MDMEREDIAIAESLQAIVEKYQDVAFADIRVEIARTELLKRIERVSAFDAELAMLADRLYRFDVANEIKNDEHDVFDLI